MKNFRHLNSCIYTTDNFFRLIGLCSKLNFDSGCNHQQETTIGWYLSYIWAYQSYGTQSIYGVLQVNGFCADRAVSVGGSGSHQEATVIGWS